MFYLNFRDTDRDESDGEAAGIFRKVFLGFYVGRKKREGKMFEQVLPGNTKAILAILKRYFVKQKKVQCVYLFGSMATGKENRFSDVDIAVLFDKGVIQEQYTPKSLSIMDDMSRSLDRNTDVVVLNRASCFLKFQIIKNGLRIHKCSERVGRDFEVRTIMEYFDFLPIRRKLERTLINRVKEA